MKTQNLKLKLLALSATALMAIGGGGSALAAGTASGTTISNQASVDYKVATISQPTINSNNYQFVVDNKVNLTVSTDDVAAIAVTPGSNDNVMTFTVTNTGNTTQDFAVSAAALAGGTGAFGGTDNIDGDTVQVFVDADASGTYVLATDTGTHINALAADASIKVFIVTDFNTGYSDGDIASYYLVAEARINDGAGTLGGALTETAGADTEGSVDIVFADGDGDGGLSNDASRDAKHSSQDDYEIAAANLSFSKSSSVISDPFNNTTNPKRIPGAIVEYIIDISNAAGAATATNIVITDSLNTEIATNGTLGFQTQYNATPAYGIWVDHPSDTNTSGAGDEYANDGSTTIGGVTASWNAGTNVLTVSGISLAAGQAAQVKFRVDVK